MLHSFSEMKSGTRIRLKKLNLFTAMVNEKLFHQTLWFVLCSIVFSIVFIYSAQVLASGSGITYQGRILKPDGTPLVGSSVQFRLQFRTPDNQNCLMYEETQVKDMSGSDGVFAITINDGTGVRTDTSGYLLDTVFSNRPIAFSFASATCVTGTPGTTTWTPNASDSRTLQVYFKDETLTSWEPMPPQAINYIPLAIESKTVGGYGANNLLRFAESDGTLDNVSPLNNAQYNALVALLAGTSTQYLATSTTQGAGLPAYASNPSAPTSGSLWYDSTLKQVKYFDGFSIQTFGTASGGVSSIITGTGLTGGPITASGTISIANSGVGTPQIASSAITDPKIASGTITGDKFDPAITFSTSGNITASQVSTTSTSTRSLLMYDPGAPGINKVTLTATASMPASYTLALPVSAPAAGQSLVSDNSGNLTWTIAGGGATSFQSGSAAAPGWSVTGNTNTGLFSAASNTLSISAGGAEAIRANFVAGAINYASVAAAAASGPVIYGVGGSDTNINILLNPKGTGSVGIGVNPASWLGPGGLQVAGTSYFTSGANVGATGLILNGFSGKGIIWTTGPKIVEDAGTETQLILATGASGTERVRIDASGNVGIGTATPLAKLDVSGKFILEASTPGAGYAGFAAPASMTTSTIWTLPAADGASGTMLSTNGAGILSWASASAGATSFLSGSAAAPGWAVTGNTNTGLFSAASNTISFSAGGTEGLRVLASSGAVDYVTLAPGGVSTTQISTGGTDANVDLQLAPKGNGNVLISNHLGVGTTAPLRTVQAHVQGSCNGSGCGLLVENTNAGTLGTGIIEVAGDGQQAQATDLGHTSSGWTGTGWSMGGIPASAGYINSYGSNGFVLAASASGAPLRFFTGGISSASYERMRIDSSGYVGIGTTAPFRPLTVNGPMVSSAGIITALVNADGGLGGAVFGSDSNHPTIFISNSTEKMRLTANGNIGIGTTAPNAKLDVNGKFILEASIPGSGYAGFAAPASMATSTIWTLPAADGASGTVLSTNGTGILSWATASAGATSFLSGSAAAPGWAVTGNTNTGLFSPASNTISLSAGGYEALRMIAAASAPSDYIAVTPGGVSTTQISTAGTDANVDLKFAPKGAGNTIFANGNVGIGTTAPGSLLDINGTLHVAGMVYPGSDIRFTNTNSPQIYNSNAASGANLQILGAVAANSFLSLQSTLGVGTSDYINFKVGNNGATEAMRIVTSGNVGIGTTTPVGTLDVEGGTAAAATNGTSIKLVAQKAGSGNQNGGNIILTPGAASGTGAPGITVVNSNLQVSPGIVNGNPSGGSSSAIFVNTMQLTDNATAANGTAPLAQFINLQQPILAASNTNVTAATAANVYVWGPVQSGTHQSITNDVSLYLAGGSVSGGGGPVTNAYGLYVNAPTGASNNYAATLMGGYVGIGTTAPNARLDVNGKFILEASTPGSGYAGFAAPASMAASTIWTLPAADGASGTMLSTNGAGILSWAAASAGATSFLSGSAAAPGWAVTGNTNTGLFSAASNTLSIATGGAEGLRVNSASGAVDYVSLTPGGASTTSIGVAGTDANIDFNLNAKGAGSIAFGSKLIVPNGTAARPGIAFLGSPTTGFIQDGANTIGFVVNGSVVADLDISNGFSPGRIQASGPISTSSANNNVYAPTSASYDSPDGNSSSGEVLITNSSAGDAKAAHLILHSTNSSSLAQYSYIASVAIPGAASYSPNLVFGRSTGAASYSETMRIDGLTGNVGIGTTAPVAALNVHGGAIVVDPPADNAGQNIVFSNGNVQTSSYSGTTTIKVCGLKDGGQYSVLLTGYAAGTTVTVLAYTDAGCSAPTNIDFGGNAGGYTTTFVTGNNATLLSVIYFATRGVAYASTVSNFYH
jgi:hypothetical protein